MSDIQRDREERQHVIEVLQNMVDWMQEIDDIATPERIHALFYAIASIKTDLKYDLLYEETSGQADKPTTKNDLGVDWESYKDVDGNCLDDLILEVLQNNFDCGNTYGYKVADEIIGLLPPATPQEPRCKDCKWWKDSDGEYRRGCGAESQCPINRKEVYEGNGYCFLYEPQESEDDNA